MSDHWITTRSGIKFDIVDPQPDMINLEDIAHGLSMTCRFGGHCDKFYSVAEHSTIVYEVLKGTEYDKEALMHDAAEAYVGDVPTPLKCLVPDYKRIESKIKLVIFDKYGIKTYGSEPVRKADESSRYIEAEQFDIKNMWGTSARDSVKFYRDKGIVPHGLHPSMARLMFMDKCKEAGI